MNLIKFDPPAPQTASLGGLVRVAGNLIEKAKPVARVIGQTISVGAALEKVDRVLSDTRATANEKLNAVLNTLAARLRQSPITRVITLDDLIGLTGEAGATDPAAVAMLLIPQFKDP